MTELKSPEGELSRDRMRKRCRCERSDTIFGDHSGLGDETALVKELYYSSSWEVTYFDTFKLWHESFEHSVERGESVCLCKIRVINCT